MEDAFKTIIELKVTIVQYEKCSITEKCHITKQFLHQTNPKRHILLLSWTLDKSSWRRSQVSFCTLMRESVMFTVLSTKSNRTYSQLQNMSNYCGWWLDYLKQKQTMRPERTCCFLFVGGCLSEHVLQLLQWIQKYIDIAASNSIEHVVF